MAKVRYHRGVRLLDKNNLGADEDWYGNNAAVRCGFCGKVFLTSQILHRKGRACPGLSGEQGCGRTTVQFTKAGVEVTEIEKA